MEGNDDESCNLGLSLGLGFDEYIPRQKPIKKDDIKQPPPPPPPHHHHALSLDLSFGLFPTRQEAGNNINHNRPHGYNSRSSTQEEEDDHMNSRDHDEMRMMMMMKKKKKSNNNVNGERRKLQLSKEQSTLLEDSFKLHTTLNPAQKQALADQLKLKPRQVEVWFQNRRARTKLKQTEVDCEFLKKCCESLSKENRRLRREVQELRSHKIGPSTSPFFTNQRQQKPAKFITCQSCKTAAEVSNNSLASAAVADVVGKSSVNKFERGSG